MESKFAFLEIGMKLDIELNGENEKGKFYPSKVLEIIEPDELIIGGPMKKSQLVLLHKGEAIKVYYNVENRGKYSFDAEIISREYKRIYILRTKRTSNVRRIQLRDYFRLPVTLDVEKRFTLKGQNKETITELCEAKDLSGGGMKLYCKYEHVVGDEIQWKFKLNDNVLEGKATVIRVEEIDSFNYKYSLGVSFTEISDKDREAIIKYIFEQQIILRIKGLI